MANDMGDKFAEEMKQILDQYRKNCESALAHSEERMAKAAVKKLKATSPKKSGTYAKSWFKKKVGKKFIVANEKYQLTHLLENGHELIYMGKATGRRVKAYPHIKPTADSILNYAEQYLEEELYKQNN